MNDAIARNYPVFVAFNPLRSFCGSHVCHFFSWWTAVFHFFRFIFIHAYAEYMSLIFFFTFSKDAAVRNAMRTHLSYCRSQSKQLQWQNIFPRFEFIGRAMCSDGYLTTKIRQSLTLRQGNRFKESVKEIVISRIKSATYRNDMNSWKRTDVTRCKLV